MHHGDEKNTQLGQLISKKKKIGSTSANLMCAHLALRHEDHPDGDDEDAPQQMPPGGRGGWRGGVKAVEASTWGGWPCV